MSIDSLALRRLALRVAIAGAPLVALAACAAVLGIDDGHLRAGADGGTGGNVTDGGGDANDLLVGDAVADVFESDSSSGSGTLPDGAPIPTGCEQVNADPTTVVFVDGTNGADSTTCGPIASPCKSVTFGISQAHNSTTTPNVYVADGTYHESLVLKAGVNVYGGWVPGPAAWARECSQATTVIVAPPSTNVTATAAGIAGSAKLSTLTLESKGPSDVQPGESIFGIAATGSGTTLTLVYVTVTTANGGSGSAGPPGDGGVTPSGPCGSSAGDGGAAQTAGGKGTGADAGWFTASGYVATAGAMGSAGSPGANGTAGGTDETCVTCITSCGGSVPSCISTSAKTCGATGQAGCGGGGGSGGAGGSGGGSSVALLAWDATVNLTMTVLQAGGGGGAASGGAGGPPGAGSPGAPGADTASCDTSCTGLVGVACAAGAPDAGVGGHAGGTGGTGASGGAGGDGSGGDAFSYVEGGNASIVADLFTKTAYSSGLPGAAVDGGNGAPGRAAAQGP